MLSIRVESCSTPQIITHDVNKVKFTGQQKILEARIHKLEMKLSMQLTDFFKNSGIEAVNLLTAGQML